MTDREPHAPIAVSPAHSLADAPASPDPTRTETNHEGNGSLMTATIATRPLPRTPPADPGERGRVWLDSLFAGEFSFPAIPPVTLPTYDCDAVECDAVARAVGCRDLFVIHADIPAGERVIADIARAAAERVLILSPNPAAADRITERLLKHGVGVLRALAEDENPTRPSAAVSKATSAAIGQARAEQAKREAAAAVAAAEQRFAAFATVAKAIARLNEVTELLRKLDADIAEQTARRDRVEAEVRSETDSPLAAALTQLQRDHDETTNRHTAELQTLTASRTAKEAALAEACRKHADATRKPGFFARLFGVKPAADPPNAAELKTQVSTLEGEVAALTAQEQELQANVAAAATALAAEREQRLAVEIATRRAAIEAALAAAEADRARSQAEAAALTKVISEAVPGEDHGDAERQLAAARQRVADIAASASEIMAAAIAEPRVVIGIPGCLEADRVFAALADDPPFGLLILDRAEELPGAEFPRLARLAERWLLVGEAIPRDEPRSLNGRPPSRNGRAVEVPFIVRLAKHLDRETWAVEADRLVCRLTPLTPEQRRGLSREPLADRPEIELRFAASDADPLLAEIAFPVGMGVSGAKSFLYHTLGEVLLRPCGAVRWQHNADGITATWPAAGTSGESVWIELEAGVREKIAGVGPFAFTAAVSFDPAAGWDAGKAEAWLANYLPPPPTSRFAALPRSPGPRHAGT